MWREFDLERVSRLPYCLPRRLCIFTSASTCLDSASMRSSNVELGVLVEVVLDPALAITGVDGCTMSTMRSASSAAPSRSSFGCDATTVCMFTGNRLVHTVRRKSLGMSGPAKYCRCCRNWLGFLSPSSSCCSNCSVFFLSGHGYPTD